MEQIFSFFRFDTIEIVATVSLFVLLLIQIFFYLRYYNKPLSFQNKRIKEGSHPPLKSRPSVSVIITAKDESSNLEQTLPAILSQDYPDYEVIVVNNGFTEETDTLLKLLQHDNPHLYHTFLPERADRDSMRKKMAMTIGIKAAKKDVLLFTEADTIPASNKWIESMMQEMTDDKDVVLGYCYFEKTKRFFERIARFDNLLYSLQYLSMALLKKPFTGVYRNIAFRKELFFENKGFSHFLNYEHSEGLFLNYIMTTENAAVALSEDSFVSARLVSKSQWEGIKLYQAKIKRSFRNFKTASRIFSLETSSRLLSYLLFAAIAAYNIITYNWGVLAICSLIFIIQLWIKLSVIGKSAKYFKAGKFWFSFIIVDLLQPFYNLIFRLSRHSQDKMW